MRMRNVAPGFAAAIAGEMTFRTEMNETSITTMSALGKVFRTQFARVSLDGNNARVLP